jgi:arabinan endo-1,5-alpha-L-arabinosidase
MNKRTYFYVMLGLVGVSCFLSCNKQELFVPFHSGKPWEDNYFALSNIENYKEWGVYNVHDPACKKFGDYYYMYSTDAIFAGKKREMPEKEIPAGYIQVRRSKDLIHWEFVGWAFPEIPEEAVQWVQSHTNGRGAVNIWAPYVVQHKDIYRLYFCVSSFGQKISYLGLAESISPEGPWVQKGCVVKTGDQSVMNAIDPSVIIDEKGRWWMHYGSFFGGLYCVELHPETGLCLKKEDQGHLIARRANYRKDNLEAAEIIYHPDLKKYFLFVSYDPLMTTYNVRVGRSDNAEGPFFDFTGQNLKDTLNDFPVLTAPYRFDNHPGWAGTGHCGVLRTEDGQFFMFHQGRLSPLNRMMVLHVRQLFFTTDGWPVVSPERYAGSKQRRFNPEDIAGEWEIVRIREPELERKLEAGQVLRNDGELKEQECNFSSHLVLMPSGKIKENGEWNFSVEKQLLKLNLDTELVENLIIFSGLDWENEKETILFTGLDENGRSVWGKRTK